MTSERAGTRRRYSASIKARVVAECNEPAASVARVAMAHDGDVPISNNWVENQIRPIAVGRSNWLFAGSLGAGKRAAAIMSLLHSARINGHDPYAYFKDVLDRLPSHPAGQIEGLLPHR